MRELFLTHNANDLKLTTLKHANSILSCIWDSNISLEMRYPVSNRNCRIKKQRFRLSQKSREKQSTASPFSGDTKLTLFFSTTPDLHIQLHHMVQQGSGYLATSSSFHSGIRRLYGRGRISLSREERFWK